jgi:5-methylcytosine-specific restriction endonuclease McrBC GTP-binding regulatory subunit McrB
MLVHTHLSGKQGRPSIGLVMVRVMVEWNPFAAQQADRLGYRKLFSGHMGVTLMVGTIMFQQKVNQPRKFAVKIAGYKTS